jgi:hypothetical protein
MHVEYAAPRRVGHALEIAADADHAFMRSSPLEPQHRAVGLAWQGFQRLPLLGESLVDHPVGGRVHARIGDRIQMTELLIQVVEIAEHAAEEEVLADVAERPLDLALRFGPIGPAGPRLKAVMSGEVDEGSVRPKGPTPTSGENCSATHTAVPRRTAPARRRRDRQGRKQGRA